MNATFGYSIIHNGEGISGWDDLECRNDEWPDLMLKSEDLESTIRNLNDLKAAAEGVRFTMWIDVDDDKQYLESWDQYAGIMRGWNLAFEEGKDNFERMLCDDSWDD